MDGPKTVWKSLILCICSILAAFIVYSTSNERKLAGFVQFISLPFRMHPNGKTSHCTAESISNQARRRSPHYNVPFPESLMQNNLALVEALVE